MKNHCPTTTGDKKRPPNVHHHAGRPNPTNSTPGKDREKASFVMKNAKLNSGAMNSVPEKAGKVNDFEQVKRDFETAHASGKDYSTALLDLSTAIAFSVVRKCIDPQAKTAADRETVSDNGQNPAMIALRRGIAFDRRTLDNTQTAAAKATKITFTPDGDPVTVTADKDAETALNDLIGETLSDGVDLVQTAALALLEQAAEHADGPGWLDRPYTIRRLSRRVYIRDTDGAAYRDDETTPIQEVYRAVRRAVQESRAMQTDPRNGYTYIEELTADGLETIYRRLGKYADLGGYACNGQTPDAMPGAPAGFNQGGGLYTADRQTVDDYNVILKRLNLTDRQAQIVRLRMQGKGYKAIASYLGVTQGSIQVTLQRIRKRCEETNFTPDK